MLQHVGHNQAVPSSCHTTLKSKKGFKKYVITVINSFSFPYKVKRVIEPLFIIFSCN